MRDFRAPDGVSPDEIDADGDGEVLAVLNLLADTELSQAGLAREVVSRYGAGRGGPRRGGRSRLRLYSRMADGCIWLLVSMDGLW